MICPFLRLVKDRAAPSAVPSAMNRCYQDPTRRYIISTAHQAGFCFAANQASCPAYRMGWAGVTNEMREVHSARRHVKALPAFLRWESPYWSQLLILFVLIAAMFATLMIAAPSGLFGSGDGSPSATPAATSPGVSP